METLNTLKAQGHKLAILSNGAKHMLISAAKSSGILSLFDQIICVDDLKTYKPHPDVYQLAADKLELEPAEISFQSSNGWDIAGAGHFGFRNINFFSSPIGQFYIGYLAIIKGHALTP